MTEVIAIDCHYIRPRFAGAFLLVHGEQAAFVEANTTPAVPRLMAALAEAGRSPAQVRWIILTHVHLDHAGGASALAAACPNATVLCHPRAARHLLDPSRLVDSARVVYGEPAFTDLYGRVDGISADRLRVVADEETLDWAGRRLTFLHTRGHANHHVCVHDHGSGGVFTGDAFGLCYPDLQGNGLLIFPSTSPTDFDPEAALVSVERLRTRADHAWLTHFGRVDDLDAAAGSLAEHLEFARRLRDEAAASDLADDALGAFCAPRVRDRFLQDLLAHGLTLAGATGELVALDMDLNAQGIAWAARRARGAAGRAHD